MKILRIDASARRSGSASRRLADAVVDAFRGSTPSNALDVTERDLVLSPPPLLTEGHVEAFGTDRDARSQAQRELTRTSEALIEELRACDTLVLSTPIYNFGIPAALKAWVDLVLRARETFRYTPEGPEGLLLGKRAFILIASGGTPVDSPVDFATPYLRHALGFIGIEDVRVIAADGLVRGGEERLAQAVSEATTAIASLGVQGALGEKTGD